MKTKIIEIKNQVHALHHLLQKINTFPLNEASISEGLNILDQGMQEVLEKLDEIDE